MDMTTSRNAIIIYKSHIGRMPASHQGLVKDPGTPGWAGPYVEELREDPWGNPYDYEYPAATPWGYDLVAHGADGEPGGSDAVADLRASELLDR